MKLAVIITKYQQIKHYTMMENVHQEHHVLEQKVDQWML